MMKSCGMNISMVFFVPGFFFGLLLLLICSNFMISCILLGRTFNSTKAKQAREFALKSTVLHLPFPYTFSAGGIPMPKTKDMQDAWKKASVLCFKNYQTHRWQLLLCDKTALHQKKHARKWRTKQRTTRQINTKLQPKHHHQQQFSSSTINLNSFLISEPIKYISA